MRRLQQPAEATPCFGSSNILNKSQHILWERQRTINQFWREMTDFSEKLERNKSSSCISSLCEIRNSVRFFFYPQRQLPLLNPFGSKWNLWPLREQHSIFKKGLHELVFYCTAVAVVTQHGAWIWNPTEKQNCSNTPRRCSMLENWSALKLAP